MWLRGFTLLVWAAVAASALFWGLKLLVQAPQAPAQTALAATGEGPRGDLARLLGADAPLPTAAAPVEPAADARFNLVGVVSPRAPQAAREGVALIAVDGKPPKAFRVGALVDGANVLQSVSARGATLGPAGGVSVIALNIAPPAPAATGQLPSAAPPPTGLPPGLSPGLPTGLPPSLQQPGLPRMSPPGLPPQITPPGQVLPQPARDGGAPLR